MIFIALIYILDYILNDKHDIESYQIDGFNGKELSYLDDDDDYYYVILKDSVLNQNVSFTISLQFKKSF